MAHLKGFGHLGILGLSASLLALTACTTVPLPQGQQPQTGPIAQAPTQPPNLPELPAPANIPEPEQKEVEAKAPQEPEPVSGPAGQAPTFETENYYNNRDGLTPPHMAGRDIKRLALLLPLSAKSARLREEATSMLQAAELATFNRDDADVLLIALDTGGTEKGASSATRAAVNSGADVILGPILAASVKASSREARRSGTPVIAFSTDQTAAGRGTYLLSFPPEAETR